MVAVTPRATKTRTRPRPKTIFPKSVCELISPPHPRRENASANQRMLCLTLRSVHVVLRKHGRYLREKCLSTKWRRIKLYMTSDTRCTKSRLKKSDIWKDIGTETDKLINIIGTRFRRGVTSEFKIKKEYDRAVYYHQIYSSYTLRKYSER